MKADQLNIAAMPFIVEVSSGSVANVGAWLELDQANLSGTTPGLTFVIAMNLKENKYLVLMF